MKINEIIRKKRKALSLTQEQIAEYLGVSTPAVNKWEKGSTYPDITLLPALARLLKTDLNTLMSFQDDLSDVEIVNFVNEVDKTVREKDYDTAFKMGIDKIHEYPTCESLTYSVIMYLNGALFLYGVAEPERYEETFIEFYERLSTSENIEIKETVISMLISYNRKIKNYSKAEELINTYPSTSVDKEEQLAILYTEQDEFLDALKIWEHRVLNSVTEIQTALMNMLEIAVKENRMQDANFYTEIYEQVSKLCHVPPYIPYIAKLQLSVIEQDKTKCLTALKSMLPAMQEEWKPQDCPLYRHLCGSETNIFSERLFDMMKNEMESGNDFSFLSNNPEYQQILEELKGRG